MQGRSAAARVLATAMSVLPALVVPFPAASAQTPPAGFEFSVKSGRYAVGLKVANQYDRSRTFPLQSAGSGKPAAGDAGPRPIQTLIWYPASGEGGQAMTVGDYARLARTEIRFDRPDDTNKWASKLAGSEHAALWAQRDAPLADRRFPLVVYAPGSLPWPGTMQTSANTWRVTDTSSWPARLSASRRGTRTTTSMTSKPRPPTSRF